MTKKKEKDWKYVHFSLDKEIIDKIEEFAEFEDMSKTEFIEHIVRNWDININPSEELISLTKDKEKIMEKLANLDKKVSETANKIKIFDGWKKQKIIKKGKAIEILKKKILNKDFNEAEIIARTWQKITGIPAIELIIEAQELIEKSGV